MILNPKLTALLHNKHSLENLLVNYIDDDTKDILDVIINYRVKIATTKELVRTYEDILQTYIENPDFLQAFMNAITNEK